MAATTMRARYAGTCAATGRPVAVGTLLFKSTIGWAIFDDAAFAAVRQAVAEGRTAPVAAASVAPRNLAARIAADPDYLSRMMDRDDSAL